MGQLLLELAYILRFSYNSTNVKYYANYNAITYYVTYPSADYGVVDVWYTVWVFKTVGNR